jgi:acetolactate synthase I/II/III large subunit
VCSATLGPGAVNLLPGTADATTDSSPVVAISAQAGLNRIYEESRQSVGLVSMFSPVTRWADVVLTPGAVPEMVRKAFKLAQAGRPGAVCLAVPEDVEAMGVPQGVAPLDLSIPRPDEPSGSQIERAAAVLGGARQPVVLAGHGAARAGAAGAFAALLRAAGPAGGDDLPRQGRVPR